MPDAKILWKCIILWNRLHSCTTVEHHFYFLWTENSLKIIVFTKYKWQMRKLFKIHECSNKMTGTNILWKYIISHALMCLQNIIHKCVSRFIYLHINSQTHNLIHIHQIWLASTLPNLHSQNMIFKFSCVSTNCFLWKWIRLWVCEMLFANI